MIKIDISGMAEGVYNFDIITPISKLECSFEEFFGDILLNVSVNKLGTRYSVKVSAEAMARMECDRSLIIFEEKMVCKFELVYRADTKLFLEKGKHSENDKEIIIREDYQYIDISEEVIEHLALELPMKRLAPEFRDKDLVEIFPEILGDRITKDGDKVDDRWSKLKNIKFN
jgi:uncharacterized metal-binding protein YceD (DUF177 family)